MDSSRSIVEMQGVEKRYGSVQALAGVDLAVAPGEVVGFLGPNGAGKTTSIKVMLGLTAPTQGRALLFGGDPSRRAARGRVGVMLQESGVPTALRVRELIDLFARYYPYALPTAEVLARADLAAKAEALVGALSGGQRQRLYFALAIVGDPDLLFLDEPTAALDVEARRAFWAQVEGFVALGKTVLFTTHHLAEADAVAQRLVVIDQGRVIAQGTPREVKARVAGKAVRFRSDLDRASLASRPYVQRIDLEAGGLHAVYTNEPERLLRELFAEGASVRDLTVTDADLEAAFVALTNGASVSSQEVRP
ncbi:MAG: ABC transporter ATP-binding protein [Trueperaceae bacterium]